MDVVDCGVGVMGCMGGLQDWDDAGASLRHSRFRGTILRRVVASRYSARRLPSRPVDSRFRGNDGDEVLGTSLRHGRNLPPLA